MLFSARDHTEVTQTYYGAKPRHPREKCCAVLFKYLYGNCGKEDLVARKCIRKLHIVNAMDESDPESYLSRSFLQSSHH